MDRNYFDKTIEKLYMSTGTKWYTTFKYQAVCIYNYILILLAVFTLLHVQVWYRQPIQPIRGAFIVIYLGVSPKERGTSFPKSRANIFATCWHCIS